MERQDSLETLLAAQRVLPVVRLIAHEVPTELAEVLVAEGLQCIEIALTTPKAQAALRRLREALGEGVVLGGGSAVNADMARLAVRAGADFVACHGLSEEMCDVCRRNGAMALPGVTTPTEAMKAWHLGARLVKVFPARLLGPAYIEELRRPLPWLGFVPSGGVTAQNARDFLDAGAVAVGVGHWLVSDEDLAKGDLDAVRGRARELVEAARITADNS